MPDRSRVLEARVRKSKIESLRLDFDTWRTTDLKNRKNNLTTMNPIWLTTKNRGTIWQKSNDEEQRNDLTDDEEQRNDLMEEQRKNQEEPDLTDDEEQRNDLTKQQRKNQEHWGSNWMIEHWVTLKNARKKKLKWWNLSLKSETRVLKTRVPRGFSSTLAPTAYKSRIKNSSFILELEF